MKLIEIVHWIFLTQLLCTVLTFLKCKCTCSLLKKRIYLCLNSNLCAVCGMWYDASWKLGGDFIVDSSSKQFQIKHYIIKEIHEADWVKSFTEHWSDNELTLLCVHVHTFELVSKTINNVFNKRTGTYTLNSELIMGLFLNHGYFIDDTQQRYHIVTDVKRESCSYLRIFTCTENYLMTKCCCLFYVLNKV